MRELTHSLRAIDGEAVPCDENSLAVFERLREKRAMSGHPRTS